ncbi:MAG: glutathione S-transferase [Gammaproteobacteria bacterium]|nr:glutathione S-transferase [Gammaproteobacteria bacterium]
MSLTFYDFPMAPSPRRARILLAEKNVPHDTVLVDLRTEEQLGDEYKKINPFCTVPALQLEDGTVLTENHGITAYLEAAYPEPPMMGSTPAEKGLVANWSIKAELEGLWAIAEALRNSAPAMKDRAVTGPNNYAQIPELAERGRARLAVFYDVLNERLEGRDYIAIDTFSMADITAVVAVDFSRVIKQTPGEHHTNILRWRESLRDRPSLNL